jgi:three-Cys-motif partner protein
MSEDAAAQKTSNPLFEYSPLPGQERPPDEPRVGIPEFPVWTKNKARLIMLYLRYFVLITKHGTYIDGFAGPQPEREADAWAAKLVLASQPQWIKHFHLCDKKKRQIALLEGLTKVQPIRDSKGKKLYRKIHVYPGDFNVKVDEILPLISQKQATFCLIDQRTFECHWQTVAKLATYKKKSQNKIELFYFLASGWLDRALAAQKNKTILEQWWGRPDWTRLRDMTRDQRRDEVVNRMKSEFGYRSVKAWPIYEREDGGNTMYYMIHATDHLEAPKLMSRAYKRAVYPLEPLEDLQALLFETPPQEQLPQPSVPVQRIAS